MVDGKPELSVSLPKNGDTWYMGTIKPVYWNITGGTPPYSVNVSLSIDGGSTYPIYLLKQNVNQPDPGPGTISWKVQDPLLAPSTQCRIKIIAKDDAGTGTALTNYTDGLFSIKGAPPTVLLVTPNGGEKWYVGKQYSINWTISSALPGSYQVDIALSQDSGASYNFPIKSVNMSAGTGKFNWTIPLTVVAPSSTCRIQVTVNGGGNTVLDASNNDFLIAVPISVVVTSPVSGNSWNILSSYYVN